MDIEIITQKLELPLYGFSTQAVDKNYTATAFKLSERTWQAIKTNGIKNKGKNIWVYEPGNMVFAGVEPEGDPVIDTPMEHKMIILDKYAYHKHIGSYSLLPQVGTNMRNELSAKGYTTTLPYIEIYGHWTNDDSKTETELLIALL